MQIFKLATTRIKIYQIRHVVFETKSQFFFKLCITLHCHERQLFCTFSSKTLHAFDKRNPSKANFQSTARIKINQIPCHFSSHKSVFPSITLWTKRAHESTNFQIFECFNESYPIPHASFETTRSRFIQILHHCSVSCLLCIFYLKPLYFGQKEPIKVKFSDFWMVGWKFTKFLMSCLKLQVSFSLNFSSLFSVMRNAVSWETVHDLDKRSPSKCKISDFPLSM